MNQKFNITPPSGFFEFKPAQNKIKNQWIDHISETFKNYGFEFIDTPIVERKENLLGKGGNTKEIYALSRHLAEETETDGDKLLRFDQTVPLALYVSRHLNDLTFPFRRAVIGPVFRGERPQKGRFRQFDQCDIDIIGSEKLAIENDALMPLIIIDLFQKLMPGQPFIVRINNRKILTGFFDSLGIAESDHLTAIKILDDIEKVSREQLQERFSEIGVSETAWQEVLRFVALRGSNDDILEALKAFTTNEIFQEGVTELGTLISILQKTKTDEAFYQIDLQIARGLDYYTGSVFETNLVGYERLGSVCSGGRYENLASMFSRKNLPGVGISIGITRLLYQLFEAGIIKVEEESRSGAIFIAVEESVYSDVLTLSIQMQRAGFPNQMFMESTKKLGKKLDYADKKGIRYAFLIGENEWADQKVQLKDLETGDKEEMTIEEMKQRFEEKS